MYSLAFNQRKYILIFLSSLFVISVSLHAQTADKQELEIKKIKEKYAPARHSYNLLNGRQHTFVYPPARGNPYYMDMLWKSGSVKANNFEFDSVLIAYEILNDLLLMNHFSDKGSVVLALNADNIQEFTINSRSFINMAQSYPDLKPEGVYYEKLYQGKTGLYRRHRKTISSGSNVTDEYRTRETLYLLHQNDFIPVKNKRNLYKAFPDKKKELKQYAREHLPYFTLDNPKLVIDLIKYYDEIN